MDTAKYFAKDFLVSCIYETAQYPLEVLMVKYISDMGEIRIYANPIDCLYKIVKEEGITGLFTGLTVRLTCKLIKSMINTLSYSVLRLNHLEMQESSLAEFIFSFATTLLLYPFETATKRMMISPSRSWECDLSSRAEIWKHLYGGL